MHRDGAGRVTGGHALGRPGHWGPGTLRREDTRDVKPFSTLGPRSGNRSRRRGVRAPCQHLTRHALLPVLALAVVACSSSGASPSSERLRAARRRARPAALPARPPAPFGAIDHATGATDVLLRYDVGGGLMMPGFSATQTPIFTLYGDGTVVFRNQTAEPPPAIGSVMPMSPLRTAKLSEEQIQAAPRGGPRRRRPRHRRASPTTTR